MDRGKMYGNRQQLYQKKVNRSRQALRRLSQSGKKGTSPTSPGLSGARRSLSGGYGASKAAKGRPRVAKKDGGGGNNPFLKSVAAASSSGGSTLQLPSSVPTDNPFLMHIANPDKPVFQMGMTGPSGGQPPPPPTYAAIASGRARHGQSPIPSFITHGPNSVPHLVAPSNTGLNMPSSSFPIQSQGFSELPPPPPPSLPPPSYEERTLPGMGNPFLKSSLASLPPGDIPPPPSITDGSMPQAPLSTGGLFGLSLLPPPPYPGVSLAPPSSAQGGPPFLGPPSYPLPVAAAANRGLHLKGVPDDLNNHPFLQNHFSTFGPVESIECFPQKRWAKVTFKRRTDAVRAKRRGTSLSPAHEPIQIFWDNPPHQARASVGPFAPPPGPPPSFRPPISTTSSLEGAAVSVPVPAGQRSRGLPLRSRAAKDPRLTWAPMQKGSSGGQKSEKSKTLLQTVQENVESVEVSEEPLQVQERDVQSLKEKGREVGGEGGGGGGEVVANRSIWSRLGGRVGDNSEGNGGREISARATLHKPPGKTRKKKMEEEGEEWKPAATEGDGDGRESEEEDEGVYEGKDSVLAERQGSGGRGGDEEMDTIARSANHPYYLRSLHQPETFPGPGKRVPDKLAPPQPPKKPQTRAPAPSYDLPRPILPRPPPPKGTSAGDYYEALVLRDQEIRKGIVKQTSLEAARAIVGSCPDMCPEKERYMRQDQRRLSVFELHPESQHIRVDHSRAIKEYSGSAADKEEPLPHELRPLGVLRMTMDYLVTMVMDAGERKWAEWYNFIWNRTRAIRKDITLQLLCTSECVELVERCARFHILCAHLLCEEDICAFDQKMNNENLTKCLQTLKEFYRDLRVKKGIRSPREAEFCCYDILLHLNDRSVLNHVELYSDGVRRAPEVRLAVDAALAVDSNNFIRFFKLVRSATYLQACVMHRYFNEVRHNGLQVLNHAHSTQRRSLHFPLADLTRMLAFQDDAETIEFCAHYGLKVGRKPSVLLVRGGMARPEEPLPLRRSPYLVEAKNETCFGEVVYGSPLPPPPTLPPPYCSFTRSREAPPGAREATPPPTCTNEDLVAVMYDFGEEVVLKEMQAVVLECLQEAERAEVIRQVSYSLLEGVEEEVVTRECVRIATDTYQEAEELMELKNKRAREREERIERVFTEVMLQVTTREINTIALETLIDCRLHAEALAAATAYVSAVLVEECTCELVRTTCEEVVEQARRERRERLEALERQFLNQQLLKRWGRWRQMVKVRQHIRQCASDIPPLPPIVPLLWQLENLVPMEKRRKLERTLNHAIPEDKGLSLAEMLRTSSKELKERRRVHLAPIDLTALLKDSLLASRNPSSHAPTHSIIWQAVMSTPNQYRLTHNDRLLLEWLTRKLTFASPEDRPIRRLHPQPVHTLSVTSVPLHREGVVSGPQSTQRIQIAVKCLTPGAMGGGEKEEGVRRELVGTSAVLLYVSTPQAGESPEVFTGNVERQLSSVLMAVPPSPPIPVLVVGERVMEREGLAYWISINRALSTYSQRKHFAISHVHFLTLDLASGAPDQCPLNPDDQCPLNPDEQLCTGLQWLAEHSPPQPPLSLLPLREYLEQGLMESFVPLVMSDAEKRQTGGLAPQHPAALVGLYNAVLDHLAGDVTQPSLQQLSWPVADFAPQEFSQKSSLPPPYWNSQAHFDLLRGHTAALHLPPPFLPPLQLPTPPYDVGTGADEWCQLCVQCLEYVAQIPPVDGRSSSVVPLFARIKALLHHHSKSHAGHVTGRLVVPWDQVVLTCGEHMLGMVNSDLWVVHHHGERRDIAVPPVWLHAQVETSISLAARLTGTSPGNVPATRHQLRRRSDPYLPSPLSRHERGNACASVSVSPVVRGVREDREKLKETLQRERTLTRSFEAQLQQWMREDVEEEEERDGGGGEKEEEWEGSLEKGLALLRMKIRSARLQDTVDSIQLQTLSSLSRSPRHKT